MKNRSFLLSILLVSGFFTPNLLSMYRLASKQITTLMATTLLQAQRRIPYQIVQEEKNGHRVTDFLRNNKKKLVAGFIVGSGLVFWATTKDNPLAKIDPVATACPSETTQESSVTIEYRPEPYPQHLKFKEVHRQETDQFIFTAEELLKDAPENKNRGNGFLSSRNFDFEVEGVIRCKTKEDDQECGILFYSLDPNFCTSYYKGTVSIDSLGVPKKYRRLGIATQMLTTVQDMAEKRGDIGQMCLYSVSDSGTVRCYEQFGFKRIYGSTLFNMSKEI